MKALLLGEAPGRPANGMRQQVPGSREERLRPFTSAAGTRLLRLTGCADLDALEASYATANLLPRWPGPEWPARAARAMARELDLAPVTVFLGSRTAGAFGFSANWFEWDWVGDSLCARVPHPSGRNRLWNPPGGERMLWRSSECLRVARGLAEWVD